MTQGKAEIHIMILGKEKLSCVYQNSFKCFITSPVSVPSSCVHRMYPQSVYFLVTCLVIKTKYIKKIAIKLNHYYRILT